MPQARPELRLRMGELFGDPISDVGPTQFLLLQGFALTPGYTWMPPIDRPKWDQLTDDEQDCVRFLIEEWDFGGVIEP